MHGELAPLRRAGGDSWKRNGSTGTCSQAACRDDLEVGRLRGKGKTGKRHESRVGHAPMNRDDADMDCSGR
jgi:hypothetical protein